MPVDKTTDTIEKKKEVITGSRMGSKSVYLRKSTPVKMAATAESSDLKYGVIVAVICNTK